MTPMSLSIHLLGRPIIESSSDDLYQMRSQKSWGLLAYLILNERPQNRTRLAGLLFDSADDPLRALRWSLAEIRRALGEGASIDGDPVVLRLPPGTVVDLEVITHGSWEDAVALPGLGSELLEGAAFRGAAAFETWLLTERRHLAATSEAILHEAALTAMSRGSIKQATEYASRVVSMNPLDENHQTLLIRSYRMAGDQEAAARQLAACIDLFARELGVAPGPSVYDAMRAPPERGTVPVDRSSVEAQVEAGAAAVSAGAVETGVHSLRTAVALADATDSPMLRITARLALAEALIHSLRGRDEEGVATLHVVDEIAQVHDLPGWAAQARAELGYVHFLRARYDRAELWLTDALRLGEGADTTTAKAAGYLGCVESDRGNYREALHHLGMAVEVAGAAGELRREAYARSMTGRIHLLRGDLDQAAAQLDHAIRLSEQDRWLAFIPWPQALRGEVELARSNHAAAAGLVQQAFARACQIGDPCWEGLAARAIALVEEAAGNDQKAFEVLADARARCNRMADPYVWLDVYILDAQCELGRRHRHPDTTTWVETMHDLASRTGMREMIVRSLLHRAALGREGDAEAATLLGTGIDNPVLQLLLDR